MVCRVVSEQCLGWDGRIGPVEEAPVVWAGGHADAATDAPLLVDEDHALWSRERRSDRAHVHTRRVLALETRCRDELGAASFQLLFVDLDPLHRLRRQMPLDARRGAPRRRSHALTTITRSEVDDHRPLADAPKWPQGRFLCRVNGARRGGQHCRKCCHGKGAQSADTEEFEDRPAGLVMRRIGGRTRSPGRSPDHLPHDPQECEECESCQNGDDRRESHVRVPQPPATEVGSSVRAASISTSSARRRPVVAAVDIGPRLPVPPVRPLGAPPAPAARAAWRTRCCGLRGSDPRGRTCSSTSPRRFRPDTRPRPSGSRAPGRSP